MDATRGIDLIYEEFDPAVEWSHGAEADAVKITLPGFKREELRVVVDSHGYLRTHGKRPWAGNKWIGFQKDFKLAADCNVDGIHAKFENENLTITLPKKNPSPQAAPPPMPVPAPSMPEPRRPSTAPPPRAPVLPYQMPFAERRPSAPEPARPAPPVPAPLSEVQPLKRPEQAAVPKPTEVWEKETKKPLVLAEEEKKRMEREMRGKMEEDTKMVKAMEKKAKEEQGILGEMEMAPTSRPMAANRELLVNVAVAVVVLIGITVYVWRTMSSGGGDRGHDEM